MTFEDLQKANEQIQKISIERKNKKTGKVDTKEYTEVHQRVKAFRILYPDGCIRTTMLSNENGVCVFKAEVYACFNDEGYQETRLLATGYAYEKEQSSYINQTSYIENCETSAVGRALGFLGIGIDTSIASADEVQNADLNQPVEDKYLTALSKECEKKGKKPGELEALKNCTDYSDMTFKQFQEAMKELGAE